MKEVSTIFAESLLLQQYDAYEDVAACTRRSRESWAVHRAATNCR